MSVSHGKIWMNGKLVDWDSAKVHVLTHSMHYGTGVFEGIRVFDTPRGPAAFRLRDHLKRLYDSAKIYCMTIPYNVEELESAVREVVLESGLTECYVRPLVYRGYGNMGVNPLKSPVEVAIAAWEWGAYLSTSDGHSGVRCMVSSWRRISSDSLPPQAKSVANYANSALAKMEAIQNGYDEAVMLNSEGMVTEGSGENIFRVKNGVVGTPPAAAGALRGITRDTILRLAQEIGTPTERVNISREELYTADELFLTGTATGVVSVREIDGRTIGDGHTYPTTQKLRSRYDDIVHGRTTNHEDWFTYVK
ncbi:MAG: branched-chain amino acid transaminase [Thermoprotei archaeon]